MKNINKALAYVRKNVDVDYINDIDEITVRI